jgi:hypothetical protein
LSEKWVLLLDLIKTISALFDRKSIIQFIKLRLKINYVS